MLLLTRELEKIEEQAEGLIERFKVNQPPVSVIDIATKLGLEVIAFNLGKDVSGSLVIDNDRGFIGFNPQDSKRRQRFTIAHEIGHFVLHKKSNTNKLFVDKDFVMKYRNANNYTPIEKKHEQEANAFAAALLMPKDFITKELSKKSNQSIHELELLEQLAKLFDVSVPAMTIRLSNLNYYF